MLTGTPFATLEEVAAHCELSEVSQSRADRDTVRDLLFAFSRWLEREEVSIPCWPGHRSRPAFAGTPEARGETSSQSRADRDTVRDRSRSSVGPSRRTGRLNPVLTGTPFATRDRAAGMQESKEVSIPC